MGIESDPALGTGRNFARIRVMNGKTATIPIRHFFSLCIASYLSARRLRSFVALGLLIGLLIAGLPSAAQADDDPTGLSPDGERAALLINQLRVNAGLPSLRVHPLLTQAANQHILDMTTSGVYGHTGSDGSSVHMRIARTGYVTGGWNGENWAVSATVEKSIDWWMDDAPHRENVLTRFYSEMGIGTAPHPGGWGLILVVDFSTGSVNGAEGYVPGGEVAASPPIRQPMNTTPASGTGLLNAVSHTVLSGDTLSSIGQRYGVDWRSIAQLNSLGSGTVLQIGAELRIPGGERVESVALMDEASAYSEYTVIAGDTLLGIALRFGLEWQTLADANGVNERSLLQIGDLLTIPGGVKTTAQEPVLVARTHTVQAGETVWVIATRYAVDWQALLQKNGLNEQALLQIGQVLALP